LVIEYSTDEDKNNVNSYIVPSAYVLIICELGYEDQTVNDLNTVAGVDATRLAGAYDMIAKVNAESRESLSTIIGFDIKKLDRIQSTLTLIVNEDL
jgi:DNA-binding Lrp family transcriptional regulator